MRIWGRLGHWRVGLRRGVGLQGLCFLDRRSVQVCEGVVALAAALDAEDDKQNPSDELEDATDNKHSNSTVELAHVGSGARVVVFGVVGAVVGAGTVV